MPTAVAVAALLVLALLAVRVTVAAARRARALHETYRIAATLPAPAGDLAVLDTTEPHAYAVPGRPGRIVVSTGLLRRLDAHQRHALLAHERAHLTGHHHRHHTAARLAAANPLPHRLPSGVTLTCERRADEAAATTSQRDTVADALLRAAGAELPASAALLAAAVTDLADRVGALRGPAPRMRWGRIAVLIGLLAAAAAALIEAAMTPNDSSNSPRTPTPGPLIAPRRGRRRHPDP